MDLDVKQLVMALKAIAEEKNLPEETVQEVVEQALAAAYRRDYGDREQEVRVTINTATGDVDAYVSKEVVERVGDPAYEISIEDAQKLKKDATKGDMVEVHESVTNFGRVAAQTAKQVILQRLREAERGVERIGLFAKLRTKQRAGRLGHILLCFIGWSVADWVSSAMLPWPLCNNGSI